jgi:antitoxin (DNA-binding transcriptional repressor) of toxin-antitoxin stability system
LGATVQARDLGGDICDGRYLSVCQRSAGYDAPGGLFGGRPAGLVTRNGKPAAALVPIDEYEALEETAEILSDPDAIAAIEAGLAELECDETVTLEDLHRELAERRPPR